jgi:hypothetical protein
VLQVYGIPPEEKDAEEPPAEPEQEEAALAELFKVVKERVDEGKVDAQEALDFIIRELELWS